MLGIPLENPHCGKMCFLHKMDQRGLRMDFRGLKVAFWAKKCLTSKKKSCRMSVLLLLIVFIVAFLPKNKVHIWGLPPSPVKFPNTVFRGLPKFVHHKTLGRLLQLRVLRQWAAARKTCGYAFVCTLTCLINQNSVWRRAEEQKSQL